MTSRNFAVLVLLATGCGAAYQEEEQACAAVDGEQCRQGKAGPSSMMQKKQRMEMKIAFPSEGGNAADSGATDMQRNAQSKDPPEQNVDAPNEEMMASIMREVDKDEDGKLTFREIRADLFQREPERFNSSKEEQLQHRFSEADLNGDGGLERTELPTFLKLIEEMQGDEDEALVQQDASGATGDRTEEDAKEEEEETEEEDAEEGAKDKEQETQLAEEQQSQVQNGDIESQRLMSNGARRRTPATHFRRCSWRKVALSAISGHNEPPRLVSQTVSSCKKACEEADWCKSFDWHRNTYMCDLSRATEAEEGTVSTSSYDHYECTRTDEAVYKCEWERVAGKAISGHNEAPRLTGTTSFCKAECEAKYWCKSFDYISGRSGQCDLSKATKEEEGTISSSKYSHYACTRTGERQFRTTKASPPGGCRCPSSYPYCWTGNNIQSGGNKWCYKGVNSQSWEWSYTCGGRCAKSYVHSYRSFYNIAHMTNHLREVEWAISWGANAVEIDLAYNDDGQSGAMPAIAWHGKPCDCTCLSHIQGGLCWETGSSCFKTQSINTILAHLAKSDLKLIHFDNKVTTDYAQNNPSLSTLGKKKSGLFRPFLNSAKRQQAGERLAEKVIDKLFKAGFQGNVLIGGQDSGNFLQGAKNVFDYHGYQDFVYYSVDGTDAGGAVTYSTSKRILQNVVGVPLRQMAFVTGITACLLPVQAANFVAGLRRARSDNIPLRIGWTIDLKHIAHPWMALGMNGAITNFPGSMKSWAR